MRKFVAFGVGVSMVLGIVSTPTFSHAQGLSQAEIHVPEDATLDTYNVTTEPYTANLLHGVPYDASVETTWGESPYPVIIERTSVPSMITVALLPERIYPESFFIPYASIVTYSDGSYEAVNGVLEVRPISSLIKRDEPVTTPTETVVPIVTETVTVTPEPAAPVTETVTVTPEPAAPVTETVTVTVTPEPAAPVTETVTVTPEPAAPVTETVTVTPEPAAPVTETVTVTPEPAAPVTETVTVTPEPAAPVTETVTTTVQSAPIEKDFSNQSSAGFMVAMIAAVLAAVGGAIAFLQGGILPF